MTPKAQATEGKIGTLYYIKIKKFCAENNITNNVKWQSTEWERIFVNHIPDEGLASRLYKELLQLNNKKTNNPIKKWAKYLDRHFSEDNTQVVNKHMKRYSRPLVIREIQTKTTMRYHFIPTRMAIL